MKKARTDATIMDWIEKKILKDPEQRRRVAEMVDTIRIRQSLVALRKARGITQKQLAERMGVNQPLVAALESPSLRNIELRTLVRAAAALGARLRVELEDVSAKRKRAA